MKKMGEVLHFKTIKYILTNIKKYAIIRYIKNKEMMEMILSEEKRNDIKKLYVEENLSYRKIGEILGVSRTTVMYVLFPEKYYKNNNLSKERKLRDKNKLLVGQI